MKPRIVHLKQSGELLTDVPGERWTPGALQKAATRIADVQRHAVELGVRGLLIVSGGGNVPDGFGRGANIRAQFGEHSAIARYSDVIGRRSTIDNTIMLAAALQDAGVPYLMLAAPHSGFSDLELGTVQIYDPELVQAAYREGKVVLMAGGSGKSGQTTDTAVVEYAQWQAAAYPDIPSIARKSTKFNGVYADDPAKHPDAARYASLSASTMLAEYERFGAVDRRCLEILSDAGQRQLDVRLQIYAASYEITDALRDPNLGTIITSLDAPSILANDEQHESTHKKGTPHQQA